MPKTGLTTAQIRDRAIDVTMAQMRRHGFAKVRLVDIARELGVSHAALYIHFADRDALFDAVSERWLQALEASLAPICRKKKDPIASIHQWFLKLYRTKREKILNDPELYEAYSLAAKAQKPFFIDHLATMQGQLTDLVTQENITKYPVENAVDLLFETTTGFHNPVLVAFHGGENREPMLKNVLDVVLNGLRR